MLLDESEGQKKHLIIDEAQKVPHIFDSIKALIDKNRRVGAFTLSGSVEFSPKTGVNESLAGRMGITKLYPMTLREINNLNFVDPWVTFNFEASPPLPAKSVETWLNRGGMPIFCSLADSDERISLINSWIETICYRDLKQLKHAEYDSEIAYYLIQHLATGSRQSLSQLALEFGTTPASIRKHLDALEALFLIYKIPSFENSRAQPEYYLFDAGVFNALRGEQSTIFSRHRNLISLVINEIYAQYEYSGKARPNLYHYRTRGGAEIDLVLKTKDQLVGIECTTSVDISAYKQRGMKSFLEKNDTAIGYFLAPVQKAYSLGKNIFVIPWNNIG